MGEYMAKVNHERAGDAGWAVDVLTAKGLHVEILETVPDKRLLFRINDDLFAFADELTELASGSCTLEELTARKNAIDYLLER